MNCPLFSAWQQLIKILHKNWRTSFGNVIEWYDFSLYGYFASILAKQFFPHNSNYENLMLVFATYALGLAARPVGAFIFGYFGDRLGHERILALSVQLMLIPTIAIGLLPTFHQAGNLAPLLLVICRLCQGICAGGQYSGALTVLTDHSKNNQRALFCVSAQVSASLGYFSASLVGYLTYLLLPHLVVLHLAWRIPFLCAMVFILPSLYLFQPKKITQITNHTNTHSVQNPLRILMQHHLSLLVLITILACVGAAFYYSVFVYTTTFLIHYSQQPVHQVFLLTAVGLVLSNLFLPAFAQWCDQYGHIKMSYYSAALLALISLPAVLLLSQHTLILNALGLFSLIITNSLFIAAVAPLYSEFFPQSIRYSGCSVSYNIGNGLLGSLSPIFITFLIHISHAPISFAFYLIPIALIGMLTLTQLKRFTSKASKI